VTAPAFTVVYAGDRYLRLGVSASRSWRRPMDIWDACAACLACARAQGKTLVVVHGDADGGDQLLKMAALLLDGAVEEGHPADWGAPCRGTCRAGHRKTRKDGGEYCPAAGNYRNEAIAQSGLWRAAVFIRQGSHGTTDGLRAFRRAGLEPRIWRDDSLGVPPCGADTQSGSVIPIE
jgi:hypothetical protein